MFRSKSRDVIFPQAEHARLSGAISFLWGNSQFGSLPEPIESYVAGITFHDRGYGLLDDGGIGEIPEDEWLEYQLRGAELAFSDPIAEALVRLHLRRLLRYHPTPKRVQAAERIERALGEFVTLRGLDGAQLQRIDRITQLCDNVAFDFCFEANGSGSVDLHPALSDNATIPVRYSTEGSKIYIDPWPLSVGRYEGFICGYRGDGYPSALDPVITPFVLEPARLS